MWLLQYATKLHTFKKNSRWSHILSYLLPSAGVSSFFLCNLPVLSQKIQKRWDWDKEGVIILAYHEISKQLFEKHIRYIKKHWDIVSLDYVVEQISQKRHLEKSVVITFDDGWKSIYTEVFPVVKNYNIPITIYLTSDIVGRDDKEFWWLIVKNLQEIAKDKGITIQDFDYYASIPDKQKNREIREAVDKSQYKVQSRCALSLSEVREMLDSGLVTIGSHTKNHPCLIRTDIEDARDEIINSKNDLESRFNVKIEHFAFPNGDYNESHIEILRKAGYSSAVSTISSPNTAETNPYELRRLGVSAETSPYTVGLQISGFWYILLRGLHLQQEGSQENAGDR